VAAGASGCGGALVRLGWAGRTTGAIVGREDLLIAAASAASMRRRGGRTGPGVVAAADLGSAGTDPGALLLEMVHAHPGAAI
jgi:hypothetical protein